MQAGNIKIIHLYFAKHVVKTSHWHCLCQATWRSCFSIPAKQINGSHVRPQATCRCACCLL